MPSLLLHLTAVERLSIDGGKLPAQIARALSEDIEYARLGAALADLPLFSGLASGWLPFRNAGPARFARLFHGRTPSSLAFKMAELVANGALVGREPGLAFVAGYVSHLCVSRAFERLGSSAAPSRALLEIDFARGVWFQRDFYGQDLLGSAVLRSKLRMVKRSGLPLGLGRGLYELVRVACQATLSEAPAKGEVDAWVRGAYLHAAILSGPWGRVRARRVTREHPRQAVYSGESVDVPATIDGGLDDARRVLQRVQWLVTRGRFTERTRAQFVELLPDTPLAVCGPFSPF